VIATELPVVVVDASPVASFARLVEHGGVVVPHKHGHSVRVVGVCVSPIKIKIFCREVHMEFLCLSTKQKFTTEEYTKVELSNGRSAYVANSPYKAGKVAYRFAESTKKDITSEFTSK
jgi:hypothetical protein